MRRILLSNKDSDLAGRLHSRKVVGLVHSDEKLRPSLDEAVPAPNIGERGFMNVARIVPHRRMKDRDTRGLDLLEVLEAKKLGVELPREQLGEIQCYQTQHVDDCRALNQFDGR